MAAQSVQSIKHRIASEMEARGENAHSLHLKVRELAPEGTRGTTYNAIRAAVEVDPTAKTYQHSVRPEIIDLIAEVLVWPGSEGSTYEREGRKSGYTNPQWRAFWELTVLERERRIAAASVPA